jgi:hypothetical protein
MNEAPALFIRIQQLKDLCWKAHINRKPAEAKRLAEELRTAAMQLVEELNAR